MMGCEKSYLCIAKSPKILFARADFSWGGRTIHRFIALAGMAAMSVDGTELIRRTPGNLTAITPNGLLSKDL